MTETRHRMTIAAKETVAQGVVTLRLERTDGTPVPSWTPGAHIDLILDDDLTRQYSLCGDPTDRSHLRVAVLHEPEGRGGSAFVHDRLDAGGELDIAGPRNHFQLRTAPAYVFIAGGIGITPLIPMLAEATARNAPWTLIYGGRSTTSMAFADDLTARFPGRVTLWPQDERGLIDLAGVLTDSPVDAEVYCCGPEPLLQAVESACQHAGRVLHTERFAPKAGESHGADTAFDVELASSGQTFTVGADESILDCLLRNGIDADFSCREGTCGTCEVTVCDGTPDHRDSVLDDEEQAAGDAMMICVSRSSTATLVIDL